MSIFDQEDSFDENKDYLAELTGPGGKFDRTKYASEADMYKAIAKGKVYADSTLEKKLKDFDELREEFVKAQANATAATKYDELKALLEQRQSSRTDNTQSDSGTQLDQSQLDELLELKLAKREAALSEKTNMDEVEKRLKERFGERSGSILRDKMKTLGMTIEDVKFLARRSPDAAINALGLNATAQETYQGVPSSNLRSDNFVPQADIRDAVFYEKMRNENPKLYFSEKMSVQRYKDMDNENFMTRYRQRQQHHS